MGEAIYADKNFVEVRQVEKFDALDIVPTEVQIEYRITTPFEVVKAADNDPDVVIRGPVYVGSDEMLDRHGELVDAEAILSAWEKYSKNPVILYNHSKTYGVIGKMVNVAMDDWEELGEVPVGTAHIDAGEKDIARKINKGMLKAFSIGFIAKAAVKVCEDEDDCYIRFTEIDWVETSVVDVPASPGALFSVQKTMTLARALEDDGETCGCGGDCCDEKMSIDGNSPGEEVQNSQNSQKLDLVEKEEVDVDTFTEPREAAERARQIKCRGIHTIWDEKNGRTYYKPCSSPGEYHDALEDFDDVGRSAPGVLVKEEVGTDLYTTPEEATERAEELGCSLGYHEMEDANGNTLFMPCKTHDDYEASLGDEIVEEHSDTASVKNPIAMSDGITEKEKMSEAEIQMSEEVTDEPIEEVVEADVPELPTDEKINIDHIDETDDEPTEEEAVVEEKEVDEDEVVTEEVEESEEKTTPSGVEVLMEVVGVLKDLDARMASVEATIDNSESLSEQIAELSATIEERDETIASLTNEKEAIAAEAEIEAEVSKRVAAHLSAAGIEATPAPEAERKTTTTDDDAHRVSDVTQFDPQPEVSKGMNGLAAWLEANISTRGSN